MVRMRTAAEAAKEFKEADPKTAVTAYAIRQLLLQGKVPFVCAGNKRLVSMEVLEKYFAMQ